jgi:hypothetical protein
MSFDEQKLIRLKGLVGSWKVKNQIEVFWLFSRAFIWKKHQIPPVKMLIVPSILLAGLITLCACSKVADNNQGKFTVLPMPTVGHGAFFDSTGKTFDPDEEYIKHAQETYINLARLSLVRPTLKQLTSKVTVQKIEKQIYASVADKILANALFLDWLLENGQPDRKSQMQTLNNALRWRYVTTLKQNPLLPKRHIPWTKGIDRAIADRLENAGIIVSQPAEALSNEYLSNCRDLDVPVPDSIFSQGWNNLGTYANPLSNIPGKPEIWVKYSEQPVGACIALTHADVDKDYYHLDMICLGKESTNACFFENDIPDGFGSVIQTQDLRGGRGPNKVTGGICSDCHAGENPFIIHPDKAAFAALDRNKIMSNAWHTPFVDSEWPQNPGPINLLDAINSKGRCTDCHVQSYAGRFPEISTDLSGYCTTVLKRVVDGPLRTMPPIDATFPLISDYVNHVDALLALCDVAPDFGGQAVDFDVADDTSFISSPRIEGPLYTCNTPVTDTTTSSTLVNTETTSTPADVRQVMVSNTIRHAKVRLFVNGVEKGMREPNDNTQQVKFLVVLAIGDVITAEQEVDNTVSARSSAVIVTDYQLDFPNGLPAPTISPTLIYECAEIIGVRHVPGANVKVTVNGSHPFSVQTASGWTAIPPTKSPFEVGDSFVATASLCTDTSPPSKAISAVVAPSELPSATFEPSVVFEGQEIVRIVNLTNGTQTTLDVLNAGVSISASSITTTLNLDIMSKLGRPLQVSDQLTVQQKLCDIASQATSSEVTPCAQLPPPRIRNPLVDEDFVIVTDSIPGARIRVYDDADNELGDNSSNMVELNRALNRADTITVNQQIGNCQSSQGYRIRVSPRS